MRLIITNYHVDQSSFTSETENPIAIAFRMDHPDMDDVRVHNNRLTANREGYPVRFLVTGYNIRIHKQFLAGTLQTHTCDLKALPVPALTSSR